MELASMLAGERFSDRPRCVCPVIGALLRGYNDVLPNARRQDLYRYAADCVSTRGDHRVQLERANRALAWAQARHEPNGNWRWLRWRKAAPDPDDGPDEIAAHVVGSIRRLTASAHADMLALVDELISLRATTAFEPSGPSMTAVLSPGPEPHRVGRPLAAAARRGRVAARERRDLHARGVVAIVRDNARAVSTDTDHDHLRLPALVPDRQTVGA
jgi:hypothetical protein